MSENDLTGKTFGVYRIERRLGAGGMGEVYQALDTRLERQVAIKFLPAEVAGDPDRLARFEREARAIAALNHPNIVSLHSIEEAGGLRFLVLELVEGATLDRILAAGRPSLDRFFELAVPLADAVAAAHGKGLVHRDLKPTNIMITEAGEPKILDFGLAKLEPAAKPDARTETARDGITSTGQVLGTLPYMAPEQLRGEDADARSDIFSLGAVLYEMATGRRPFRGASRAELASEILRDDPAGADELRPELPRHLARLLRLCLKKQPEDRLQAALDLRNELRELADEAVPVTAAATPPPEAGTTRPAGPPLLWIGFAALALIAALAAYWSSRPPEPSSQATQAQTAVAPRSAPVLSPLTFGAELEEWPAWSPDGRSIVYSAEIDGFKNLFLRDLDRQETRRLTEGSRDDLQAAWSPDGTELLFVRSKQEGQHLIPSDVYGYYSDGDVWRLELESGREVRVLEDAVHPSYSADGAALLFDADWAGPRRIWTADPSGRNPRQLTTDRSEEVLHTAPRFSPDGSQVAFRILATTGSDLALAETRTGEYRRLTADDYIDLQPAWDPSGKSLYFPSYRGGGMNIWRLGLDTEGGQPAPPEQITTGAGQDVQVAVGPDGRRLAFAVQQLNTDLWLLPMDPASAQPRGEARPLVATSREESRAAWFPDSASIVFNSDRDGDMNLYSQTLHGEPAVRRSRGQGGDYQAQVDPTGERLVFFSSRSGNVDIWTTNLDGEPTRLTQDPALDLNPFFSPNGERIAFMSDRSGRLEVWVMNADGTQPVQLTSIGAKSHFLRWSRDGESVLFTNDYSTDPFKSGNNVFRIPTSGGQPVATEQVGSGAHMSLDPVERSILDVLGHRALWIYPLEGSAPYEIYRDPDPDIRIDYPSWSPDGRWVVFDRVAAGGGDLWLLTFD